MKMAGENPDRNDDSEQRQQKVTGEAMQDQRQKGNGDEDGDAFARAVARALNNDSGNGSSNDM